MITRKYRDKITEECRRSSGKKGGFIRRVTLENWNSLFGNRQRNIDYFLECRVTNDCELQFETILVKDVVKNLWNKFIIIEKTDTQDEV